MLVRRSASLLAQFGGNGISLFRRVIVELRQLLAMLCDAGVATRTLGGRASLVRGRQLSMMLSLLAQLHRFGLVLSSNVGVFLVIHLRLVHVHRWLGVFCPHNTTSACGEQAPIERLETPVTAPSRPAK